MADSEDETDRKGRDKFRRERSDYTSDRKYDRRSTWKEDHYDGRRRSRDEDEEREGRRRRYPPSPARGHRREWSPPMSKRFRHEPGWYVVIFLILWCFNHKGPKLTLNK